MPLSVATRFPHALLITVLFNTVIAMLLTAAGFSGSGASPAGFGETVVYSQCIGLSMFLVVCFGWRTLWPSGRPNRLGMVLLVAAAIPFAWLAGSALAGWLFGRDVSGAAGHGGPAMLMITAAAGVVATLFFWGRERLAHAQAQTTETQLRDRKSNV